MNENSLMEVVKKRFANFDLPKMAWLFSTEINYKNIKMVDMTSLYVCDPGFINIATPQSTYGNVFQKGKRNFTDAGNKRLINAV